MVWQLWHGKCQPNQIRMTTVERSHTEGELKSSDCTEQSRQQIITDLSLTYKHFKKVIEKAFGLRTQSSQKDYTLTLQIDCYLFHPHHSQFKAVEAVQIRKSAAVRGLLVQSNPLNVIAT